MFLIKLIKDIKDISTSGNLKRDLNILGLTSDSRKIKPGFLFIAQKGGVYDGEKFISKAIKAGAGAILTKNAPKKPDNQRVPILTSGTPRKCAALLAAKFYSFQPKNIAAITGTNGKTSVVNFLSQIWKKLGTKSATLGTLGFVSERSNFNTSLTTPDPIFIHKNLVKLKKDKINFLALEASSHGIEQNRIDGLNINTAAFTNLSHDHLDYHKNIKNYFAAKKRLFEEVIQERSNVILNVDSGVFNDLLKVCKRRKHKIITYGQKTGDLRFINSRNYKKGQIFSFSAFGETFETNVPLFGKFQLKNLLCAMGIAISYNHDIKKIVNVIPALTSVKGRCQCIAQHPNGAHVYLDYAHTPEALKAILIDLSSTTTMGKLYVVFGCGGNRDKNKRSTMGKIASQFSDGAFITDDNPRNENPRAIRRQILAGFSPQKKAMVKEVDKRQKAIKVAINQLHSDDSLVIAGKGHEDYQIIGEKKYKFSDANIIEQEIKKIEKEHKIKKTLGQ